MMLLNLMVRLLAAVAITGLWVGPAVCMDNVSQIINSPVTEPAAISTTAKKVSNENTYHVDLSSSVVNSKAFLPKSAIQTTDLTNIFKIVYTNKESRLLSQPLNYYELPDGESIKRDFRSVKNDNVVTESPMKSFSSDPWVADKTLNGAKDTNVPVDVEKCFYGNDNVFSEFVFEVMAIADAMVDTANSFASTLKSRIDTLHSNGLEFENAMPIHVFIVLIFVCSLSVALVLFICHRGLLMFFQKSGLSEHEGTNVITIKKVYLTMTLENDNSISCVCVHANEEDEFDNGINNDYVIACVYPSPGVSINEILLEAMQM